MDLHDQNEPLSDDAAEESKKEEKTKLSTRIFAFIGAVLMILLVFFYSYSIATGNIFKW